MNATESDYSTYLDVSFPGLAPMLKLLYPIKNYPAIPCCSSYYLSAQHIMGDFVITCPSRRGARWMSSVQPHTYLYMFSHDPYPLPFARHASEIPFAFMAQNLLYSQGDITTSMQMAALWNSFAVTNDPNALYDLPVKWPAYTNASDANIFLNTTLSVGTHLRKTPCDFWDSQLTTRCESN